MKSDNFTASDFLPVDDSATSQFARMGRVHRATRLIKDLALHDVYVRVTHLLQGLAHESSGKSVVSERLSQQEIGNRVGASRDMVNRVIKELIAGGYIAIEHKAITLIKKFPLRW